MIPLINADALKAKLIWLYSHGHISFEEIIETIDEQPKYDAVPGTFIRELIDLSRKVGADQHAESLEILLRDWIERKEE